MSLFGTAETDAFLASIVSSSSDSILSRDLSGTITSWNAGAERILGYSAEEAIGQPITLIFPPDRYDEEHDILERVHRGDVIEHFETVRRRKDGRYIDMSISVSPIRDSDGKIVGVSAVGRDVTEIRQAQERYRVTLESIGDAVITTDVEGRITFVNPVAEALTGWRADDALGRPLGEVFRVLDEQTRRPLDPTETLNVWTSRGGPPASGRTTTRPVPPQFLLVDRSGVERPIDERAAPIQDRRGAPAGVVWVFHDVTATREAERAASRLAAIVTSSDDAIVGKDLEGVVTSWNEAAERMFGYTAQEMIGQSITRIIPPDRLGEEREIIARFHRGERTDHFSTVRVRKDGSPIRVSITVSPIRDERGRIVGASKIARDITVLHEATKTLEAHARELETKVRERTKVLEEMVTELESVSYSLSHDMRGPLRAIHSFSEIVLDEFGDRLGAEGSGYLRRVISAAGRLDRLIQDVLAFTRLSHGDGEMTRIGADALVRGLVAELTEHSDRKPLVRVDPLPDVMGHETLLSQCMANLLANAIKFVRRDQRPVVHVFAEDAGDRVRLCVRDNGIGIDEDGQTRIFAMFERLPTEEPYAGTGLGLAIVRKSAERMGGSAGVRSVPGEGSTFWVELRKADG